MILREINSNRAAFIIGESLGVQLKDFFTKYQKKLILGKHKVQNLPKEFQKSIKILFDLNDEEFELFRAWATSILERPSDDLQTINLAEAIGHFLVAECKLASVVKDKEKDKLCARIILKEFLKENPDGGLIEFLSSEIPYGANKKPEVKKVSPRDAFNEKVISTILEDNFPDNLNQLRSDAESLSIDFDLLKNRLEKSQQVRPMPTQTSSAPEQTISTQRSRFLTSEDTFDVEDLKVYAQVTKVLDSGLRFLAPIAVEIDDQLIHLDKEEAKTIFPNTGDLVWYVSDQKRTLNVRQFGTFSVELSHIAQKSQDAMTRYSVKQFISRVDPVLRVDASVDSLPKLGDWINQNEERLANSESIFLFKNELIKPHFKDDKRIQFETKMEVLEYPKILDIDKKLYVTDFKTSNKFYDFSPIDLIIKRLIKQANESSSKFTKAQLSGLIQNLEEFKTDAPLLDPHHYDEAIKTIDKFISFQENADQLIADILEIDTIKAKVNAAIAARVLEAEAGFEDNKSKLLAELDRIRAQMDEARKAFKIEEDRAKKLKTNLAADISKVYAEAVEDGKKTLSQSALFEGILNKENAATPELEPSFMIYNFDVDGLNDDALYKLVPPGMAYKNIVNLLDNIHELGFSFILSGSYALFVAKILAFKLSKKQIDLKMVDVYPGASRFPEVSISGASQTLILQNFDISPISIYGRKLLEDAYSTLNIKESAYKRQLILVREDTGLGLDTPKMLNMFAIHINTDRISEYEENSELIDLEDFEDMLKDGENYEKFKMAIRAVRNNLTKVSFKDDSEQLSSVLLFLIRQFS